MTGLAAVGLTAARRPSSYRPVTSAPVTSGPVTTAPVTSGPAGAGCAAAYKVTNSWPGGFQREVSITNTGTSTTKGWTLGWTFPDGQTISQLWNGAYTQSGATVRVTNVDWNGALAPGQSATVGFLASYTGTNNAPSSVSCG